MTAYLALDIGEKRIGLAYSETGFFARPHGMINRKSKREDFVRLARVIDELKVTQLVVGLPYSLSGDDPIGPQAQRIMRYVEAMSAVIDTPVAYFDESYSTVEAKAFLAMTKRKNIPLDAAAAAVILQKFLAHTSDENGTC